jgi:hypothetical protein
VGDDSGLRADIVIVFGSAMSSGPYSVFLRNDRTAIYLPLLGEIYLVELSHYVHEPPCEDSERCRT